ncbi:LysM peptidoglycan-binding domain-containing protein [Tessaracoccus aquimaris]|uniref:LysM peptidoglycan-binding domain-containing protein n=1 Tax=Tessaracoccus aquimaris TaxID=1332264 RepID=UPI0011AB5EA6|nr:LysM peptidoglycan-binding domain-containing protein [Tessaracoccus aquimaris]
MRWARAAGAAALLLAVVVGAPVLLLQWGSPGALLAVDWAVVLSRPADPRLILGLLSVVGWVAWLVLTLTIAFEVLAVASRHRIRLALPGTAWLRPAMGALVAAALAVPTVAQASPPEPGQPTPAPTATATATATVRSDATDGDAGTPAAQQASRPYQVRPGDELWTVAEEQLGSGERWREIVALNPDIDDSLKVRPGQSLRLPSAVATPTDAGAMVVVVQRGDSLWSIAERVLGDGERWREIFDLNRDQIADPDEIDIGWALTLPSVSEPAQAPPRPSSAGARGEADAAGVVGSAAVRPGLPTPPPVPPRDAERPSELGAEPVVTTEPAAEPIVTTQRGTEPVQTAETTQRGAEPVETTQRGVDPAVALGALGSLLAVGVLGGLAARRRAQLHARPVGRRLSPVTPQVSRLWAALSREVAPTPAEDGRAPTDVLFGWDAEGAEVWLDLEQNGATVLTGAESAGSLAAALTSLSSAPWSQPVDVVCVGGDWPEAVDEPRIEEEPDKEAALVRLTRLCSARRVALREQSLEAVRSNADLAPQWAPTVFVFEAPLSAADLDRVADALALGRVGVGVLALTEAAPHIDAAHLDIGAESGTFAGRAFTPQLIAAPARRALIDLFLATGSPSTEPAPGGRTPTTCPPTSSRSPASRPTLRSNPCPTRPKTTTTPPCCCWARLRSVTPPGPRPTGRSPNAWSTAPGC